MCKTIISYLISILIIRRKIIVNDNLNKFSRNPKDYFISRLYSTKNWATLNFPALFK